MVGPRDGSPGSGGLTAEQNLLFLKMMNAVSLLAPTKRLREVGFSVAPLTVQ